MRTTAGAALVVLTLIAVGGCELVDPMRPNPQADTEIFGNLMESTLHPSQEATWVVRIRVGVPRALGRADEAQPTPDVAGGIVADVVVTGDTIVILDDRPAAIEDIGPGFEVVAVPIPGRTQTRAICLWISPREC